MAHALNSHPRAIGQALKRNPFSSADVPCHRVITSNYFIGGYFGEWAKGDKVNTKMELLKNEGVVMDSDGFLDKQQRDEIIFSSFVTN